MNTVGLIVEYNPLHYGHVYHFEQAKKTVQADAVVIVMSGQFLQRGEPALVNKWARTEMALEMGVDLVFELPYVYSTQQAHYFAQGAVQLLSSLPFVNTLCFGSESGEIRSLEAIADFLYEEPREFKEQIKVEMSKGNSYPQAYSSAILSILKKEQKLDPQLISKPNNILGLHYLMALKKTQSHIRPTTIKREKAEYHDRHFSDHQIASATSIREALFSGDKPQWDTIKPYIPPYTLHILQREARLGRGPVSWENYFSYVAHSLLSQSPNQLRGIYEMEEGIENRFKEKILMADRMSTLIELVKSKRYTWNRIQRMILHTFTQFTKEEASQLHLDQGPTYLRLLGYSPKGRELLHKYKKEIRLPVISAIRKNHPEMLTYDLKASSLHALGYSGSHSEQQKREVMQTPLTTASYSVLGGKESK